MCTNHYGLTVYCDAGALAGSHTSGPPESPHKLTITLLTWLSYHYLKFPLSKRKWVLQIKIGKVPPNTLVSRHSRFDGANFR